MLNISASFELFTKLLKTIYFLDFLPVFLACPPPLDDRSSSVLPLGVGVAYGSYITYLLSLCSPFVVPLTP